MRNFIKKIHIKDTAKALEPLKIPRFFYKFALAILKSKCIKAKSLTFQIENSSRLTSIASKLYIWRKMSKTEVGA